MNIGHAVSGPGGVTLTVQAPDAVLAHSAGNISTSNADLRLVADEMFLQAGTNTVRSGTGNITVRPYNTAARIALGATGAATVLNASELELASSELDSFGTSNTLVLGGALQGGAIRSTGATSFSNPSGSVLLSTAGDIDLLAGSTLVFTGASGNLSLAAPTGAILGGGSLTASNLRLRAANGIGSSAAPVLVNGVSTNLSATNTGSGQVVFRADSGDVSLIEAFSNGAGGGIELSTVDGSISTGTVSVASGGALSFVANATGSTARTLSVGTGGITANGAITLLSADDMSINGIVNSGGGDIVLVAGNATGMNLLPKATEPTDTDGGLSIFARVIAGAGNISIAATESVVQTSGNAASAGLQNTGALTVRTYNDSPQGARIDLRNDHPTNGNSNGDVVLETRMAADATAPAEPASGSNYAASDIEYKSATGLAIKGIGTGADYVGVAATQNINVNALGIQARNLTLIASNGSVNVNVPITKSQINRGLAGGSLNLLASGDVNINAASAVNGVSIGEFVSSKPNGDPYVDYFNHDLRLVATNNISIQGGIYITGNLSLRADASAAEAASSTATKAAGDGTGGVSISVAPGASRPVEVRALNIVVGETSGTNHYGVEFFNMTAGTGVAAVGANLRLDALLRAGIPDTDTATFTSVSESGGNLNVFLNGGLTLTGGTINASSVTGTQTRNSAIAGILGKSVMICPPASCNAPISGYDAANTVRLVGGTASANNSNGGGAVAAADAVILARDYKQMTIRGDLFLVGGMATSTGSAQPSATALIDPTLTLVIRTGGSVVLQSGQVAGNNVSGAASARIVNEGNIELFIGGNTPYTYTNPASGIVSVLPGGLLLIGGGGSGILDKNSVPLPGTAAPITINFTGGGAITQFSPGGGNFAPAVIQTGVTTFDESLLSYIIFAANEETRAARIRRGLGVDDDLGAAACQ